MAKTKKQNQANEFDQTIAASVSFFEKNQKKILYGVGTCLVIIIAALLIHQFYITPRNQRAKEAIFQAEQLFQNANYEKALEGDETNMGFLTVADKFGGTKVGNLAHLYAGLCYEKLGKYEEAVDQLESYSGRGDEMISPAALGALGNCYAQLGQNDKAAETLLKAAKTADNASLSPTYLIQAGELYEAEGKPEEALKLYNEVKTKYVNSMAVQQQDIDRYIERVAQ